LSHELGRSRDPPSIEGTLMPYQDLLIKNGHVVTMDPDTGDLLGADVHIRDGVIHEIGVDLQATTEARIIDVAGKVVLPGLIDTHRHVWQGAIGGTAGKVSLGGYFGTVIAELAPRYEPDDVYAGTLWGALQALNAGVTTVADWSHIVTTPEHADANLQALHDSGIRGLFLYGPPVAAGLVEWYVDSTLPHPDDARRVRSEHFASGRNGRLTMGLGLRGPELSSRATTKHDFDLARELDVPISIHCGLAGYAGRYRTVETLSELGLLGSDVNYAHANLLTDDEYRLIAASGGSISPCPSVDMLMAIGTYPATGRALGHGITVGLSVDTIAGTGTDLFGEMRVALAAERSRANASAVARDEAVAEVRLDQRDTLRLATLDAAKAWHMDAATGSLTVGKQADVIVIDAERPHLQPLNEAVTTIVMNAGPSDVDTVVVAGEIVKSGGALVGPHVDRALALVVASNERLTTPAGAAPAGA
jgi:5-methylthioadenosine/S-adenosylhomocysteine deaminase